MQTRRNHSREFKLSVCRKIESGEATKAQTMREHYLSGTLLDRWVDRYRQEGEKAFSTHQPKDMSAERRIEQLEQALGQAYLDIKILRDFLGKKGPLGRIE